MDKFKIDVNGVTTIEKLQSVFTSLHSYSANKLLRLKKEESVSDIMLLLGALVLFTKNDAEDLFNEKKDVNERTMVGCVYRYMYCAHIMNLCNFTQPDIDIEYDRMRIDGEKLGPKAFSLCHLPKATCTEEQRTKCNEFIGHEKWCCECDNPCEKHVIPDLIIHMRNSNPGDGNGMVVEFKRNKNKKCFDDDIKIAYSTCLHGTLRYKVGATVRLSRHIQVVSLYRDSEKKLVIKVYTDWLEFYDPLEIGNAMSSLGNEEN